MTRLTHNDIKNVWNEGAGRFRLSGAETVSAYSNNISPYTITQWTGNSSLAAMKPYMAIADKEKKNAMKKFDEI